MDPEQAHSNLTEAIESLTEAIEGAGANRPGSRGYRAARQVLLDRGWQALGITPPCGTGLLPDLLRLAAAAPASQGRRTLALLLVRALGIDGLVPVGPRSGPLADDLCRFMESALSPVLLRSGYPFRAGPYDKLCHLRALHASLDRHLEPFEPTFPPWLQGPGHRESG